MDGTLTEPRQSFELKELSDALCRLADQEIHIGIITGSDEDYLREQMGDFLVDSPCRNKVHLLPCNGTKYFKPPMSQTQDFELIHEVSMKDKLGEDNYKKLLQELIYSQVDMSNEDIPLTGHFINCRGSIINWCPIGRNANLKERSEFIEIDKDRGLRKRVIQELKLMLDQKKLLNTLTIKFGGDTSFDIYPKGWDKTYGLRYFQGWDVWFVGDKCSPEGNDYELYKACTGKSYVSSGPEHTVEIISGISATLRGQK